MMQTGRSRHSPPLTLPRADPIRRFEVNAVVTANRPIIGHEFEIVFHAPAVAENARPGQFVEILFGDNYAPLVRRPFSLYRVDRELGICSVLYLARGAFTSGLALKQERDVVSLIGPLGQPFAWSVDSETQHILVAGGLGAPPLYFLARAITQSLGRESGRANRPLSSVPNCDPAESPFILASDDRLRELARSRLVVINAARTESLLVGLSEFGELDIALEVMTDDGSMGVRGMATDLLVTLLDAAEGEARQRAVYACGPMPMLRAVGEIAIARGLPCQISIETPMPCGIGICQGCATPVRNLDAENGFSYALACVDGPVFEARDLMWP